MKTIYLGLGSNVGMRDENVRRSILMLKPEIAIIQVSPLYDTEPMYNTGQPRFLNVVCEATTEISAADVLKKIKGIENAMGEHKHNEPRVIDLDLLFYGSETVDTPELKVPHPRIAERAFVLIPMSDIAPNFTHPVLGSTIVELRDDLGVVSGLKKYEI